MLLGIFVIGCVDVKAGNISDYTITYVNEDIDQSDNNVVGKLYCCILLGVRNLRRKS